MVQPEFDKRVYLFKVDTKIIVDSSHIDLYILLTRNEKSIGLRGCLAIFRFYAFFILGFLLLRQIVLLSSFSCLLEFSVSVSEDFLSRTVEHGRWRQIVDTTVQPVVVVGVNVSFNRSPEFFLAQETLLAQTFAFDVFMERLNFAI